MDYSNLKVNEYDSKTNKIIKVWDNRDECIKHYEITLNYFNKLVALPQKRWLRGKSYLKYAIQDG